MCVLYVCMCVCDIFVLISVGGLSTEQSHCLPGLPTVSETEGFKANLNFSIGYQLFHTV